MKTDQRKQAIEKLSVLKMTEGELKLLHKQMKSLGVFNVIATKLNIKSKTVGAQLRGEIPIRWDVLHEAQVFQKAYFSEVNN